MYIIEEGKAYLVDGEVGYLVNFTTAGEMKIEKENTIEITNQKKYTYNDMYAKLNVAYILEQRKKEDMLKDMIGNAEKELKAEIEKLTKENEELKALVKELENKGKEVSKEDTQKPKIEEPIKNEETKEENTKDNKKEK